jgi:hypothetical protein
MTSRKSAILGAALLLSMLTLRCAPAPRLCTYPQSPRDIGPRAPYDGRSSASMLTEIAPAADWVIYQPRCDGPRLTLKLCGQHYHSSIETPQGCPGELPAPGGEAARSGEVPPPGQWVEVHTVYAAVLSDKECDPEHLDCCAVGPFVVRGFSARVTKDDGGGGGGVLPRPPIIPPTGRPLAEWSGSNTGPDDKPGGCKPLSVQWSFRLGCGFTVSQAQLRAFPGGGQGARPPQTGQRLSKDLTLVP